MTDRDRIYMEGIERLAEVFGYEATHKLLMDELEKQTERFEQLFSINGVLSQDISNIIAEYPDWRVMFREVDGKVDIILKGNGDHIEEQGQEIIQRVEAAFERRNKLPGLDGVRKSLTIGTPHFVPASDDETEQSGS